METESKVMILKEGTLTGNCRALVELGFLSFVCIFTCWF